MKRVLCIILSCVLVIGMVTVPAFAATVDSDPGPNFVNLLDSFSAYNYSSDYWDFESNTRSFSYRSDDNEPINFFSVSPLTGSINPNDDDNGEDNPTEYMGELIFVGSLDFVFYCTSSVDRVDLVYYDRDGRLSRSYGDYVETISSPDSGGSVFTFYFDISDALYTNFTFEFYIDDIIPYVTYESLALYRDAYQKRHMPKLSVLATGTVPDEDGGYRQHTFYSNDNYTYNTHIHVDEHLNFDFLPYDDRLTVFVKFKDGFVGSDKLTMNFITTGVFDNYYDYGSLTEAGLYFKNSYGDEYNIPISGYFSKSPDLDWYGHPCYYVTVTADLSLYDLTDGDLTFSITLNARSVNIQNYKDYYMKIDSAFFYFGANEFNQKLDQVFNRFTNWWFINVYQNMQSQYSWIVNKFTLLLDKLNTIDASIVSLIRRVTTFDNNVSDKFTNLFDKLESYFGVPEDTEPPDHSDQQQEIQDSIDDMEGVGDDFANAGDEIEELLPSTPNYEDTGLPGLTEIAAGHILELRAVFVVLWDNDFVIQILTFSCLLALGGFILFGER